MAPPKPGAVLDWADTARELYEAQLHHREPGCAIYKRQAPLLTRAHRRETDSLHAWYG